MDGCMYILIHACRELCRTHETEVEKVYAILATHVRKKHMRVNVHAHVCTCANTHTHTERITAWTMVKKTAQSYLH